MNIKKFPPQVEKAVRENVQVFLKQEVEEIRIEAHEIEKLGDISYFQNFDPKTDFPLYVDKHGVENKDRVRLYYGPEFWNALTAE